MTMANQLHIYYGNPTAGSTDGTEASSGTELSPISVTLDASKEEQKAVKCAVRCDSGYYIEGSTAIKFVGDGSAKWRAAADNNYADEDAYLYELNGTTYPATDYVFPKKEDGNAVMKTYKISLATPATKTLTFTPKGQQVVWVITLETTKSTTGILHVASSQIDSDKIYNLQGVEIKQPHQGVYIKNGKKIIIR